jgi:hypothetical protein
LPGSAIIRPVISRKALPTLRGSAMPTPLPAWRDRNSITRRWLRSAISAMSRDHCTGSGSLGEGGSAMGSLRRRRRGIPIIDDERAAF